MIAAPAPSPAPAGPAAIDLCFETIRRHSRSFALASRLLPRGSRAAAAVVYTWCRRADDTVDEAASAGDAAAGLQRLRSELEGVYAGQPAADLALRAFAEVVRRHGVPRFAPEELLAGMAMDLDGYRYARMDDLLLYCFRVAGTVGLMMSHVLGVSDARALRNASHLGIAMQLTNICRDVAEDWERGRLYLPEELLARAGIGGLGERLGRPFPAEALPGLRSCVRELLGLASRYYASGDAGLASLHWRSALSVRTARLVYASIGRTLERRGHDPLRGRAVVSGGRKAALVGRAAASALAEWPRRAMHPFRRADLRALAHLRPERTNDLVRL